MKNPRGKIEIIANVAVILFVLYYAGSLVKQYIHPSKTPASEREQSKHLLKEGGPISLPGVEWSKQNKTLILAVAPGCEFCAKNAPLYKLLSRLVKEKGDVKLLPLLPTSSTGGESFLDEIGLEAGEIRKGSFKEIGITNTPTIILVDNKGIVSKMWVGQLNQADEAEVIKSLDTERTVSYVSAAELKRAIDKRQNIVIVDISDRENYAQEHISIAKNIPVDELQSRVLQELPADKPIVLYCGCSTDELGNIALDILRATLPGDADVKVLKGGLDAWAKEGLPIVNKILTKYNQ